MRDFSNISRCSLRPEYHEEVEDRPLRFMMLAAKLISAFERTESQAHAMLMENGARSDEAFLAVKAARVLIKNEE